MSHFQFSAQWALQFIKFISHLALPFWTLLFHCCSSYTQTVIEIINVLFILRRNQINDTSIWHLGENVCTNCMIICEYLEIFVSSHSQICIRFLISICFIGKHLNFSCSDISPPCETQMKDGCHRFYSFTNNFIGISAPVSFRLIQSYYRDNQ